VTTRTVKVVVRHSANCMDRHRGSEWRRCNCRKSLRIYEGGGTGSNYHVTAKTRSWEQAEKLAQEYLDSFAPENQELKRLGTAKERHQVRIEDAVGLYCADLITRLGNNGTVAMARSIFGHIDPETNAIRSNGHFFDWLNTLPTDQRPTCISEFTRAHLRAWRSSWKFSSDLTAVNRWTMVKGFFNFCEVQGWISDSPAWKLKALSAEKENHAAIFTDEQCAAILNAVAVYKPKNVPTEARKSWQQRLTLFVELLRWSGMDLIDAIQFRSELVDSEGVLRYRRQKTGVLATVPLPAHVAPLLRRIPLERDSVGAVEPFRTKGVLPTSDGIKWARRLETLYKLAGITEVRSKLGIVQTPHARMFRDTFAVRHLKSGVPLYSVSKMLGHSTTAITELAYLPWVKELEQTHLDTVRRALVRAAP
jgi:integrase